MTATGKDVHELKGLLKEASENTNAKNEAQNRELGMIEMETRGGKRDIVRQDKARAMERKGFRPTRKSFIVPELQWKKREK